MKDSAGPRLSSIDDEQRIEINPLRLTAPWEPLVRLVRHFVRAGATAIKYLVLMKQPGRRFGHEPDPAVPSPLQAAIFLAHMCWKCGFLPWALPLPPCGLRSWSLGSFLWCFILPHRPWGPGLPGIYSWTSSLQVCTAPRGNCMSLRVTVVIHD